MPNIATIKSSTNEVTGNTPNDFDVLTYGAPTGYTLENTTVDGINCLKFQYTGGVHYYRLYSKKDTNKTYGSDKWFVYMKVKLGGDANSEYPPEPLTHISSLISTGGFTGEQLDVQFNKNTTDLIFENYYLDTKYKILEMSIPNLFQYNLYYF